MFSSFLNCFVVSGVSPFLLSQFHPGPERVLTSPFISTPENPNRVLPSVFSRNGCLSRVVRATAMGFIHLRIRMAVVLFLFLSQDKPGGTLTVPPIRRTPYRTASPCAVRAVTCVVDTAPSPVGNPMFPFPPARRNPCPAEIHTGLPAVPQPLVYFYFYSREDHTWSSFTHPTDDTLPAFRTCCPCRYGQKNTRLPVRKSGKISPLQGAAAEWGRTKFC